MSDRADIVLGEMSNQYFEIDVIHTASRATLEHTVTNFGWLVSFRHFNGSLAVGQ